MTEPSVEINVPFQAMFDADSAMIDLQGTAATDADKTRAVVHAAYPAIEKQIRHSERERIKEALLSERPIEAIVKRREPLISSYTKIAMTKAVVDARRDLEAALASLEIPDV